LPNGDSLNTPFGIALPTFNIRLVHECIDMDGDGVPDLADQCQSSDLRSTVFILGCDSGIPNLIAQGAVDSDGCSLADLVTGIVSGAAAQNPRNRGAVISSASRGLNVLIASGLITSLQHEALMKCFAARFAAKP